MQDQTQGWEQSRVLNSVSASQVRMNATDLYHSIVGYIVIPRLHFQYIIFVKSFRDKEKQSKAKMFAKSMSLILTVYQLLKCWNLPGNIPRFSRYYPRNRERSTYFTDSILQMSFSMLQVQHLQTGSMSDWNKEQKSFYKIDLWIFIWTRRSTRSINSQTVSVVSHYISSII